MSDNLEQANRIEKTLLEKLQSQDKTYNEYNCYLENIAKKFATFPLIVPKTILLFYHFQKT